VIQGLSQELGPNAEDGLATTATSMMSRLGASTEEIMRENVAPGVAAVARETLNASLATAASDQNIERSQRIVGATTDAAVRAMTAALADGIRHDLVPAIGEARARAQPAAIQLLSDPAFHQALGSIVREVSREAVLGTEEALDTIGKNKDPNQDGSLLGGLATRFAGATAIFLLIGIVIVGLIVFLLVRQARSRRRAAREAAQRREELMMSFVGMAVSNLDLTDEQKAEAERLGLFRMPGTGAGPDSDRRHRPAAGGQFQPEFG
jgi:hypothetical protein